MQQTGSEANSGASRQIEVYPYPAGPNTAFMPAWEGWAPEEIASVAAERTMQQAPAYGNEAALRAEFDKRLAEETRKGVEAGRERGRLEGRQAERDAQSAAQTAAEERRVRQVAELLENFARERDRYLLAIEHEVVELALAVAARILRREAQMDPLLLTGAVRVALGQLAGSTQVRLCVPAAELDLWAEAIALLPKLAVKPTVVSGEGMLLGDCALETELGSVDLGIRAQLGEIERGFFDSAGGRRAGTTMPDGKAAAADRQEVHREVQR